MKRRLVPCFTHSWASEGFFPGEHCYQLRKYGKTLISKLKIPGSRPPASFFNAHAPIYVIEMCLEIHVIAIWLKLLQNGSNYRNQNFAEIDRKKMLPTSKLKRTSHFPLHFSTALVTQKHNKLNTQLKQICFFTSILRFCFVRLLAIRGGIQDSHEYD